MAAKLQYIAPSSRKDKRYMAVFDDGAHIHFGMPTNQAYVDHKDRLRRDRYILRHSNERHLWATNPYMPSSLSRYILWGDSTDINENIRQYKNRYRI